MRPGVLRNLKIFVSVFAAASVFASPPSLAQKHHYAPDVGQRIDIAGQLSKEGKFDDARRVLSEALQLDANCCDCLNSLGITYFKEGRLKEAEANFRGALKIDPLYLEALCNLGLCLYQQGESHYAEAIVYFSQALELTQNKDFQLHKNLADVLRDKGDFKEAAMHYGEAVRLQPDYAPAYNGLSMLYYRLKQFDKAYEEALKAVKFRPDYALGYFYLGMIETSRKHVPQAIQYYETSLKYEPNPRYAADTRQKIADLKAGFMPPSDNSGSSMAEPGAVAPSASISALVRSQEWEKAENELSRLLSTPNGKTPNNYNNYGYVLARRNKLKGAVAAYQQAIDLKKSKFPKGDKRGAFPEAHYNLGQILRLNNQPKDAENEIFAAVQEAKQMNKRFPAALNAYALMRKSHGDLKGAKAYYVSALTQAADTMPVIHYNYAILLEKTENSKEAVAQYRRYLTLAPAGKNAKAAQERLRRLTGVSR